MRLSRAFLTVSFFSYICALLLVFNGVKVVNPITDKESMSTGVLMAAIILYGLCDNKLNLIWAGVYGSMALVSFLGLVQWVDYLHGNDINLFMCLWDFLIGVSFVYESELYAS